MNNEIPLGKETEYPQTYDASLLFPVARQIKRDELALSGELPFKGSDIWNAYEMSWLNAKGKPQVAIGIFEFDFNTVNIVESKSFKLYLNSFNQSKFQTWQAVEKVLINDLSSVTVGQVQVTLLTLKDYQQQFPIVDFDGLCIDELDIEVKDYDYDKGLLCLESDQEIVEETLVSHLLKSNCLITNQPDWASVSVEYKGSRIDRAALLRYLISFRTHNEFHEQCVERVFNDIMQRCQPQELTVYARYTRRGGLDINPFRTNKKQTVKNLRLSRQ
ncbi:NADPH-dependent 7-cyano-7-deazaguanine reductase QueF [Kangiella sp. HZ709]|uniref:NADPH-dependent 7-cyano-7-deazaguanine reductase QueF n=1 Tax=Kangiella sp. HZ709 TaxID=2666328 RepID=UPI0012B0BF1A|nr:NADPH-dependent 7-cyano-7-deazaguanine reductase QueF [Kangiella sp. HZ709]MRX27384.1 NADPH-dependent 7-cyano-7-deazaguanine reductase QueF [Kangiella sp. HZ709]